MKGTLEEATQIIDRIAKANPCLMVGEMILWRGEGALQAAAEAWMDASAECVWSEDWEGYWETECGNEFVFSAEGPLENGFRHCPYCGMDLREKPYKEENSERHNKDRSNIPEKARYLPMDPPQRPPGFVDGLPQGH